MCRVLRFGRNNEKGKYKLNGTIGAKNTENGEYICTQIFEGGRTT